MVTRRLAALGLAFGAIPPAKAATVQVMVGVDVTIRTERTKRPVSVGAFADAEVLGWTWRPAPLAGVVVRYRAGKPEHRSLLLAGRAGMGVVTCCDGGGHYDLLALGLEGGRTWLTTGGPRWYLGGEVRGGALATATAGVELDDVDPFGVATLGLGLPLIPSWIVGRPFRVGGVPELPAEGAGAEELASVATFLRLARELRALGAPAALSARCLAAARDEAVHAALHGFRSCWSPDLTPRRLSLRQLAVESLVDGVVNEGMAAADARRRAELEREDGPARAWACIAADEARHAALSGDVLSWCVREGGLPVRDAVAVAERRV